MKRLLSYIISTTMTLAPSGNAQSTDDPKHPSLLLRYQHAKAAYQKAGSLAFANAFPFLSTQDSRYLALRLGKRLALPDLKINTQHLTLNLDRTEIKFGIANVHDGYVTLGDEVIHANFSESLEDIGAALEPALQKRFPAQFDKRVSQVHGAPWVFWFVNEAHAAPASLVWGGLAVILGALLFKAIREEQQAASKAAAAREFAYVQEPAYQQALPAAGATRLNQHQNEKASTTNSTPSAPVRSTALTPPAVKINFDPTLFTETGNSENISQGTTAPSNSYHDYLSVLCEGEFSIAGIMNDVLGRLADSQSSTPGYSFLDDERNRGFPTTKRMFIKQVLQQLKSLAKDPNKMEERDAYLAYCQQVFGVTFTNDELETFSVPDKYDEIVEKLAEKQQANRLQFLVNDARTTFTVSLGTIDASQHYDTDTETMTWRSKEGDTTMCRVPATE